MGPKASVHAGYDLKYHFVWTPKYRKELLIGEVAEAARGILEAIAGAYGMEIDTQGLMDDHIYVFISSTSRYSSARVMQKLKRVSARELFARFPWQRWKL